MSCVSTAAKVAERFVWEKTAMAPRKVLSVAKKVSKVLTRRQVPHALAGGLALGFHGFNRMTRDVGFVIPKSHLTTVEEEFGATAPLSGHLNGVTVKVDGVKVDFLFAAKTVRREDLGEAELHAGLPIIKVDPLVAMKMGAGRAKDTIDVIEVLKLGKVSTEEVAKRLKNRADDLDEFRVLIEIAKLEKAGKPKKGRRLLVALLAKDVLRD